MTEQIIQSLVFGFNVVTPLLLGRGEYFRHRQIVSLRPEILFGISSLSFWCSDPIYLSR